MLQTLTGHKNVVYALSFNLPFGDKVGTGSFDTTAKLWNIKDGTCLSTFRGHQGEIVCLSFDPQSLYMATGSMDKTAKVWNLETNQLLMDIDVNHLSKIRITKKK
jgi:dynein assembly factor with WDR repeat domains 1